jgi:predicted ATPase
VFCLGFGAVVSWCLGYPDQALAKNHQALTFAQKLRHPFSLGLAWGNGLWLQQLRRDGRAIKEEAEAVIAFATEQGFPHWLTFGVIFQGWALAVLGQPQGGIARIHQGLAIYQRTGGEVLRPYFLALLAEACAAGDYIEEGWHGLAEALSMVDNTGERFYEAELYRLKGELLLRRAAAPQAEAETCFHQALNVAHWRRATSLELRVAISLSSLWQQQGRSAEARELLAPIYGWFTEGFDTADLREAKALLEALA